MSAICGAIGLDGQPWGPRDLQGMLAVLRPMGTWSGPAGRCGVAVASTTGPAVAAGGALVIAGDVRLDNRGDLLAVLGLPAGTSDDHVVLAAYERWGESCLDRLVGAYALAIVDQRRGGVLLARDHVGDRPLVVHRRPHVVAFASNALAMTGFAGVGHDLDEHKAVQVLALTYGTDRTMVAGVRWLPAGHALWVDATGVRSWPWWQVDPTDIVDLGSLDAHADALRETFDLAVRASLRGAARVGAQVSGGLDSTSVAATAAGMLEPDSLPIYTAVPPSGWTGPAAPGLDNDESSLVRDLVAMVPTLVPTWVHARDGSIFEGMESLWERGAVPPRNPCNTLWASAITAQAAADGVDVLLGGAGGNLAFSADGPQWLAALARAGRPLTLARAARSWSGATDRPLASVLRSGLIAPLVPPPVRRARRIRRGAPGPVAEWLAASALRPERVEVADLLAAHPGLDELHRVDHRVMLWAAIAGAAGQADTRAEITMTSGVERRDPTADRRVLEIAARQPEWVRRVGGHPRAVARVAMADRLPASIVWRDRRGAQLPEWLDRLTEARRELTDEVAAMRDHPRSRDLIDVERLTALVSDWPERDRAVERAVRRDYRSVLLRGAAVSRYLRWFDDRARLAPATRSANGC